MRLREKMVQELTDGFASVHKRLVDVAAMNAQRPYEAMNHA